LAVVLEIAPDLSRFLSAPFAANRPKRVVLVHGIHDSEASMHLIADRLQLAGRHTLSISLTPSDGSVPLEHSAKQLLNYIEESVPSGERFDLVGFSMGGLVCRYYAQKLGGAARIERLVTISAPNHGTWLAWCSNLPACRQMRPGSEFLRELNRDYSVLGGVQLISFWTPLDLVIIPAASSPDAIWSESNNFRAGSSVDGVGAKIAR